jgi:hypothetical protein
MRTGVEGRCSVTQGQFLLEEGRETAHCLAPWALLHVLQDLKPCPGPQVWQTPELGRGLWGRFSLGQPAECSVRKGCWVLQAREGQLPEAGDEFQSPRGRKR